MTVTNVWTANAPQLAEAYFRDTGRVGFELITRTLLAELPTTPQRIVDIGGGFGQQAMMLAEAGHSVVVVDIDSAMLAIAERLLSHQDQAVRSRIDLVLGDGASASRLVGTGFDLACCHSVLMYEDDPDPILGELVNLVRPGGLISVISLNPDAYAMRSGLEGSWYEAARLLTDEELRSPGPIQTRKHTRQQIERILEAKGATADKWFGLGIFTDHLTETITVDDPEIVYLVESLAGSRDPYRQVARCFHLLATRAG